MPCARCGSRGEPALRKPRPYSAAWSNDPGTYFGCPECGHLLARLSGPAANRPSDVPSDRLPEPSGLLREEFLPELGRSLCGWIGGQEGGLELGDRFGAAARAVARRLEIPVLNGLRLPGRVTVVPSFVLAGLGSPWIVAFCEIPGSSFTFAEAKVSGVLEVETVETVVIVSVVEFRGTARVRLRLIGPEGEDPVPLEGSPIQVRQRRRADR